MGKREIWATILALHRCVMSSSGVSVVSFVKEHLEQILRAAGLCWGALGLVLSLQPVKSYHS